MSGATSDMSAFGCRGLTLVLTLVPALLANSASAQAIESIALSLADAIEIARGSNPGFQRTRNDLQLADADVKSARGALYLPSATASAGMNWQGAGEQQFGSLTADQLGFGNEPAFYFSSYRLGLDYRFDGATLLAPGQAKASRIATRAQITNADAGLVQEITQRYIEVLRQEEELKVSDSQFERARFNLRLSRGQYDLGSASAVDVAQADVAAGRAEVTVLQTQNALENARIRLLQAMGVDLSEEVVLTTSFTLSEPTWEAEELFALGLAENPNLASLEASRNASAYAVKIAKSSYLPTVSLSASLSGFTRQSSNVDGQIARSEFQSQSNIAGCLAQNDLFSRLANPLPSLDCTRFVFTDDQEGTIRSSNDVFPFNFQKSPPTAGLTISVPLFQGFSRSRQVEAAQVERDDMDHNIREQELALRADIATTLADLRTGYRTAVLERRNRDVADRQLELARERFSLGLADFLELVEAETLKVEADRSLVAAIFTYHDALATLEAVVGVPLRQE